MRRTLAIASALVVLFVLAGCGSDVAPSDPSAPRITGINPSSGSTFGGTPVTITGSNFASGATVTIGAVPASDVVVVDANTITAKTPQHAAGAADVLVLVGAKRGSVTAGYTFVAPQGTNTPPVINSIVVQGAGPREPAQFASLDEAVKVTASVTDAETDVSQLTFAWSSDTGTFSGNGPSVAWTAPHTLSGAPATVTLKVTVTEHYLAPDPTGLPVQRENTVSKTSDVRVHDSIKEVGDLAVDFLVGFSKQLDPDYVMRNFTPTCGGTGQERSEVVFNQQTFTITGWAVGPAAVTVPFSGSCPFRNVFGDACARVGVRWTSTNKNNGASGTTSGFDQVTAIFENDQWRGCASDYDASVPSGLSLWFKK